MQARENEGQSDTRGEVPQRPLPTSIQQSIDLGRQTMLTAQQIMTTGVVTIQPEASINEAIELLLQKQVGGLPVVDEGGNLVGMITEYALLAMVYDKNVLHERVSSFMTRQLLFVEYDVPITEIANKFILHRVRRLPVTRAGRLVGLVSRSDVLRGLYRSTAPVCTA